MTSLPTPADFFPIANMTLARGVQHAPDDETKDILSKLLSRINSVRAEQTILSQWCDRADVLYYPPTIRENFGPDLWPEHESATINGRQHVSGGFPTPFIDVPSALQAVEPIENVLASDDTEDARVAAAAYERMYVAWKQDEDFDLKWHKAILTKSLYGRTAGRVYYDPDGGDDGSGAVCMEVIQQPRHLFMGFKTDSYEELEWAAYRMYYEPNALTEEYGVEVVPFKAQDGNTLPFVQQKSWDDIPSRPAAGLGDARIEVWDYWYRQPIWKGDKFRRMDTMNVVVAGNIVLRPPTAYKEYRGKLPYLPLNNTFVPGMPSGRPDLYDVEPLLREKMERLTSGSQMIANVTSDNAFQLTGPDAPLRVPQGLKPIKGGVIAPGPGNRIEVIAPFIAQFQLEQFLGRIDRELAAISGLNELLLGLAPAQVLSSSKAINALISQFEARLSLRRKLLYKWRRDIWKLVSSIMYEKNMPGVREVIDSGGGFLEIVDPSLNPRDDMETMQRALNAVNNKLASQRTAMNWVGIDDPETEQDLIREERTDATMFPESVQVMAQLLGALQALGLQAPANAQGMAQGQLGSGQADLRTALGAGAQGSPASQYGTQPEVPTIPGAPAEAQPGNASGPLVTAPDNQPVLQGMIQGGQAKGRIMTQQKLGRR